MGEFDWREMLDRLHTSFGNTSFPVYQYMQGVSYIYQFRGLDGLEADFTGFHCNGVLK